MATNRKPEAKVLHSLESNNTAALDKASSTLKSVQKKLSAFISSALALPKEVNDASLVLESEVDDDYFRTMKEK